MAELRKKTQSILLHIEGKKYSIELFPSYQWEEGEYDKELFRVRINDVWHCPAGKYSFFTRSAIGELVATLMSGEPLIEEEAPYFPEHARVSFYMEYSFDKIGSIIVPPYQKKDGRYYCFVRFIGERPKECCCDDLRLR